MAFWQDVCDSQEAWWLRKACQRSRRRLIKGLADKFGIKTQCVQASSFNLALQVLLGEAREREGVD